MASFSSHHFPLVLVFSFLLNLGASDFAAGQAECANQLVGLLACLTYVEGTASGAPSPDCCAGFKQVMLKSKKCLCVLIKDRNQPGLSLKINITLALTLPADCGAPANISDCPRLLNLPPNSKDAKDFEQFEGNATTIEGNSTNNGSIGAHASGGRRNQWFMVEIGSGVLIWSLLFVPLFFLGKEIFRKS